MEVSPASAMIKEETRARLRRSVARWARAAGAATRAAKQTGEVEVETRAARSAGAAGAATRAERQVGAARKGARDKAVEG
jgi:hypothetical protein